MVTIAATASGPAYEVRIGHGLLGRLGDLASPFLRKKSVGVIADARVAGLHGDAVRVSLREAGYEANILDVPPGEDAKSWDQLRRVTDWLLQRGTDRADAVIALGGGAVGDLTGLATSLVKRGCAVIQIPTTLLSQVDSSVGGKTAINTDAGKNLIGTFHQPALVLADLGLLATLDDRQLRAGYAEIVKIALIQDARFFSWLEANGHRILSREPDALEHAVTTSVVAKARIVEDDARETTGRRALLNLGHTFGHALEAEAGFGERLLHGEAVALGTVLAARFSVRAGRLSIDEARRIERHLSRAGLPADLSRSMPYADAAKLVDHMRHDKKKEGDTLPFVLLDAIGAGVLDRGVALPDIEAFLSGELGRR